MKHGIWDVGGGSSDAVLGFAIYGGDYKEKWWFKGFIMPLYRLGRRIDRAYDWVRYRFTKQHAYHLVDTGLEPGYYDPDYRMLHACFSLLVYHVEEEMGGRERMAKFTSDLYAEPDPNALDGLVERQADRQSEAMKLYHWWTVDRPAREAREAELTHDLYGRKWGIKQLEEPHEVMGIKVTQGYGPLEPPRDGDKEKHAELDEISSRQYPEDQGMLHRLIDIRGSLWI